MNRLKRLTVVSAITAASALSLGAGTAAAGITPPPEPTGKNCHGKVVSTFGREIGGLGKILGGPNVRLFQQSVRAGCQQNGGGGV